MSRHEPGQGKGRRRLLHGLMLRFSLGMLLVLVAATFIGRCGAHRHNAHWVQKVLPKLFSQVDRVRDLARRTPKQRLPEAVRALDAELELPLSLHNRRQSPLSPNTARQLDRGNLGLNFEQAARWSVYIPTKHPDFVIKIGPATPAWRDAHRSFLLALAAIIAVVFLTGLVLATPLVRRLGKLEQATLRIAAGDLNARADVTSRDALGDLARRFNTMADRVQSLLDGQRQLLQAVSHELRTPVARIRFSLELLAEDGEASTVAERVASIEEDLAELDQLLGELLRYIRSGDGSVEPAPLRLDPAAVGRELAAKLAELHPKVTFALAIEEPVPAVWADPDLFRRVVHNLLHNAHKYGRSRVRMGAQRDAGGTTVWVEDDGPGIAEPERERVFLPFARLDRSRDRRTGGVGLGLAIVRRTVQAHGGEVAVEDSTLGGARLVTRWPDA